MLIIIADSLEFIGGLMIAFAALRVHHRFLNEHQVDDQVFISMKIEQKIGIFGVIFLTAGFFLHLWDHLRLFY